MKGKLENLVVEVLYKAFVVFFYYYLFMTFVTIKPFAFAFHPATDLHQLTQAFAFITGIVSIVRGVALMSDAMNSENEDYNKPITYIPSQRY